MFARFYPRKEMESAYAIPYGRYAQKGIRGVIFDIDNTLVMHGAPADERARELFCRLEGLGLKTCLLSNNKERRVKPFADAVGSPYIFKADKPSVKGPWRPWGPTAARPCLWATSCSPTYTAPTGRGFTASW